MLQIDVVHCSLEKKYDFNNKSYKQMSFIKNTLQKIKVCY